MVTQRFHLARSQGLIGLAAAAVFSLIIDFALYKSLGNKQLLPAIVLIFMAIVLLFTMIAFGRLAFFPPVLYDVSNEGLNSYYNAQKGQLRPFSTLVPWKAIRKISAYQSGKITALKVDLEPNHGLPTDILSIVRPSAGKNEAIDWENTVFLRAETDFGSVQQLADELESKRVTFRRAV
jgi:hypothetical protein